MTSRAVYFFLFASFFTGRLYIFADDYYLVKVFHSIGQHIITIMLVGYIVSTSRGSAKVSWGLFFIYSVFAGMVYTGSQLTMDQDIAAHMWQAGHKTSALNRVAGNIGFIQDLFIPLFLVLVFYIMERLLHGRFRTNNGGN